MFLNWMSVLRFPAKKMKGFASDLTTGKVRRPELKKRQG